MAALRDPKHELFCQELAKGKSADQAYFEAGFKRHRGNASRMSSHESIRARVAEILAESAKSVGVTRESLIAEAEAARLGAMSAGQYAAAIAAVKEKGILSGERVERSEKGKPGEFDNMNANELRNWIDRETKALGLSAGKAPRAPGARVTH